MPNLTALARRNRHIFLIARRLKHFFRGMPEPELNLLHWIVDSNRAAIDIGAHSGLYSQQLARLATHVVAVEAIPELAANLRRLLPGIEVIHAAASDRSGMISLAIPEGKPGLSSVAHQDFDRSLPIRTVDVECITIDELLAKRDDKIGFIKIDVEGHELAVLEGAKNTIAKHRPALLIEAEERHRRGTVRAIFEFFEGQGYEGFYLDGHLRALSSFDPAIHQSLDNVDIGELDRGSYIGKYINNFIFIP